MRVAIGAGRRAPGCAAARLYDATLSAARRGANQAVCINQRKLVARILRDCDEPTLSKAACYGVTLNTEPSPSSCLPLDDDAVPYRAPSLSRIRLPYG
jgi:hypothetical protein